MRIYLIGFMGSGKSTTGRQLADALEWPFMDLDEETEAMSGHAVTDIFVNEGEAAFRKQERAALTQTAQHSDAIIATGGGTPCFANNMGWMQHHGMTIYLTAPVNELYEQLHDNANERPLLKGYQGKYLKTRIRQLLGKREAIYLQAHHIVPAYTQPVKQILSLIST